VAASESRALEGRFSVVITCYNQREFIGDAVRSAISQGDRLKEVIVVDDASSDGSLEVLVQCAKAIQVIRSPANGGASVARNLGAASAQGDYLVFLDGDDVLLPWALDVYERIVSERKPAFLLGRLAWFEGAIPSAAETGVPRRIEFVDYEALVLKDRPARVSASVYVIDRAAFWGAGGWSREIFQLDDVDLVAKLGFSAHAVLISSPATALHRVHASNCTHTAPPFFRNLRLLARKEREGRYPGGPGRRHARRAYLGGPFFFWTRRALRAGLYKDALELVGSGWLLILTAVVHRCLARINGRRPIEVIDLTHYS
jgi:glycosyltransferase involved in cell wall biosynthesis